MPRALRLLTGRLEKQLPWLARSGTTESGPPALLLFIDGLSDHPLRALGGRTPLGAADTPALDRLAREGRTGLADPVAPRVVPDTASGTHALVGQTPMAMRRGPVEALGAGLDIDPRDVALRANFATVNDRGVIIDRRAGRIREEAKELARALDRLALPGETDVVVRVMPGTEHRLAVVFSGPGLSASIAGSDPGEAAPPGPPLVPRPLDPSDEAAARTARLLAIFEQEAQRVLRDHTANADRIARGLPPANSVLTRGPGHASRLMPVEPGGVPISVACVSGDRTVLGIARLIGAATHTSPAMTANLDTDLGAKFTAAARLLRRHQLVVLHAKGADIDAHDGRAEAYVVFIERIDRELARFLDRWKGPLRIAVAADHGTHADTGQQSADAVPILIWGTGFSPDDVDRFDELSVGAGGLQRFPLQLLVERLLAPS